MIQQLRPELVKLDRAETTYPDPGSRYLTTDLLGSSAVRVYHDFADLSPSGTLGDPSLATRREGEPPSSPPWPRRLPPSSTTSRGWAIPERPA